MPREIWAIASISFMSSLGLGLVVPSLPTLGAEFGVGIAAMSVAISGFAAARLTTNLALQRLLGLVALRPVLAAGLAFQGITTILSGLGNDYTVFIVFRILSGVGSAAYTIGSTALMVALAPPDKRGRAMSLQGGASGIGTVTGPALGGALALSNPHLPLIIYGTGLALGSLVTIFLLRRARNIRTLDELSLNAADPEGAVLKSRGGALRRLFSDPIFVTVVVCQAVTGWVYYGMRTAILPAYLESLGYLAAFVGVLLAVAAGSQLAGTALGGTVSDRLGRFPPLISSYVVGLIALALLGFAFSPIVAILAFVALGVAAGVQQSTGTALLADSRGGRTAAAAGVYWMTFDVFAIVGPTVSGIVSQVFGVPWALGLSAVVLVVAMVIAIRTRLKRGSVGRPGATAPRVGAT